jgi:hypothetical protein
MRPDDCNSTRVPDRHRRYRRSRCTEQPLPQRFGDWPDAVVVGVVVLVHNP